MSQLYENQWTSTEPTESWVNALRFYSTDIIKEFIIDCELGKQHVEYPPTVRKFHLYCRAKQSQVKEFDLAQLTHDSEPVTKSRIAEMKKMSSAELIKLHREER